MVRQHSGLSLLQGTYIPSCSVDRPEALSARKIRPAQVPQIGLPPFANVRSSGMSPHRSAMRAIVVLSPANEVIGSLTRHLSPLHNGM